MKYLILFFIVVLFNCNSETKNNSKEMKKKQNKLVMYINASFKGEVGFGEVYQCQIKENIIGDTGLQKDFTMTILDQDKTNSTFLSSRKDTMAFEAAFNRKNDNEPYLLMPISGFVDINKTSWEIEYLKEIK
jgi:hypothetical protein